MSPLKGRRKIYIDAVDVGSTAVDRMITTRFELSYITRHVATTTKTQHNTMSGISQGTGNFQVDGGDGNAWPCPGLMDLSAASGAEQTPILT